MYESFTGKSKNIGMTFSGSMSKVATVMMNVTKKFALAGKGVKKRGKCTANCKPLSIDQSWLSEAASIKLTRKFVTMTTVEDASDEEPLSSILLASASDGI